MGGDTDESIQAVCPLLKPGHWVRDGSLLQVFLLWCMFEMFHKFQEYMKLVYNHKNEKKGISSLIGLFLLQIPHQLAIIFSDTIIINGREDFLTMNACNSYEWASEN